MIGFMTFIHILICILLATVILMQSGRGGGLTEGFAAAESMFGAKTNSVLIKATTICATIFLVTSLSLAFLSSKKGESLMVDSAGQSKLEKVVGEPGKSAAKKMTAEAVAGTQAEQPSIPNESQ